MTASLSAWPQHRRTALATWLLVICGLLFLMVLVGGYTRLTNSGLSIVDWEPIHGAIPPLTNADWDEEFAKYRESPEFKQINAHFTVEEFKPIFWTEWFHRFLGRLTGVVSLLPLVLFWSRARSLRARLFSIPLLIGVQGALGWYMVRSGLNVRPEVSQYRLTAHLVVAVLILGVTLWTAWTVVAPTPPRWDVPKRGALSRFAKCVLALICVMIMSGGFVAGTDAGFRWNTFPTMEGKFVPDGLYATSPAIVAAFEDDLTVQWNHRVLALIVSIAIVALWIRSSRSDAPRAVRTAVRFLVGILALQVALGVSALMYGVPVELGVMHQGGAILLFCASLLVVHRLRSSD